MIDWIRLNLHQMKGQAKDDVEIFLINVKIALRAYSFIAIFWRHYVRLPKVNFSWLSSQDVWKSTLAAGYFEYLFMLWTVSKININMLLG